jgi:hypothetical protein
VRERSLSPGRKCAESGDDERALAVFMDAIEKAQSRDRHSVRDRAAVGFNSDGIGNDIIIAFNVLRASRLDEPTCQSLHSDIT